MARTFLALCLALAGLVAIALSTAVYHAPLLAQDDDQGFTPAQIEIVTAAAEDGNAVTQYSLGYFYLYGYGATKDYPRSTQWLRFAAEQGHAEAQYRLGLAYILGMGVTEDPIQAHKWLNIAASRLSGERHNEARQLRNLAAQDMSVSQLRTARSLAAEWKPSPWSQLQEVHDGQR